MKLVLVGGMLVSSCIIWPPGGGAEDHDITLEFRAVIDPDVDLAGYEALEVRAFPDHPDGFDLRRRYEGDAILRGRFAVDETQFPAVLELEGDPIGDAPSRMLMWLTNRGDPDDWVAKGEPFGTSSFALICDENLGGCESLDEVRVVVDRIATE